jgi:hypothetical protein
LIGVVAALMGVAGGELLIPTIVLLYGLDIKIAGSLSLAVSLPTMLVAFARYSRDASFMVLSPATGLRSDHGRGLGGRNGGRKPSSRSCAQHDPHPGPGRPAPGLGGQSLAAPLTG